MSKTKEFLPGPSVLTLSFLNVEDCMKKGVAV
jgi:hypothetical protein